MRSLGAYEEHVGPLRVATVRERVKKKGHGDKDAGDEKRYKGIRVQRGRRD